MEINLLEITHHAHWVLALFLVGYTFIVFEELIKINKASTALLMAIGCWTVLFLEPEESAERHLFIFTFQMFKVSQVLFFIMGALTIVEIINAHKGFKVVTESLVIHSKKKMLWSMGIITFFLSSVLDNLTTTIVMVALLAKLVEDREERLMLGGVVVIAANVGGAWTPIGDVATTLLWINGEVTTLGLLLNLFVPSFAGLVACLLWFNFKFKGNFQTVSYQEEKAEPGSAYVLLLGICALIFVPIFKVLTDLPAFMGMMLGLGIIWMVTDIMHRRYRDRKHLSVLSILPRVDMSVILFYLGVLLSINALESAGLLKNTAVWLDDSISPRLIPVLIGLVSSVVDNVSLVAATIGMYDLNQMPVNSPFWQLVAYCAGTGGSILIIGSAAGVAFMAMEKVSFLWYMRKIAIPATLTYFGGIFVYFLISPFTS